MSCFQQILFAVLISETCYILNNATLKEIKMICVCVLHWLDGISFVVVATFLFVQCTIFVCHDSILVFNGTDNIDYSTYDKKRRPSMILQCRKNSSIIVRIHIVRLRNSWPLSYRRSRPKHERI